MLKVFPYLSRNRMCTYSRTNKKYNFNARDAKDAIESTFFGSMSFFGGAVIIVADLAEVGRYT